MASRLFADLKDHGLSVELLTEQARMYIAKKKYREKNGFTGLDTNDQFTIMREQAINELALAANSSSIVIADSCALSALFYVPKSEITQTAICLARRMAPRYSLIFRCAAVVPGINYDPLRIHSYEESIALEPRIDDVLALARVNDDRIVRLYGDNNTRALDAGRITTALIYEEFRR